MIVTPQSNIYLCNTELENNYENQLTFSNLNAQTNYFNNLQKLTLTDYTYIRKDREIVIGKNIDEIINYNYLFYINSGFTNKRYYCFITDMRYISENSTAITIETDVFQTFMFDITYNDCFIEREHVNNDTRGLHTYPESLETGPYICNSHTQDSAISDIINDLCYIISSNTTWIVNAETGKGDINGGDVYNGVYSGTKYYRFDNVQAIKGVLELYDKHGQGESINGIFLAPKILAPHYDPNIDGQVQSSNTAQFYTIPITNQLNINGYTPKNNKLLCYPYNYLLVSNNNGSSAVYEYENFSNNPGFKVYMALTPGCSIRLVPLNYKNIEENDETGINMGKLPICSYTNDMYTNWLTQNSVNILGANISADDVTMMNATMGAINDIGNAFMNVAGKNYLGAVTNLSNAGTGIANALITQNRHELIPPQTRGNLNSGDVITSSNKNNFHFYKMSIKKEYAKIIDDYFSMYGYKVASLKKPNITGRQNWNYVKTMGSNITGSIPQIFLDKLNSIFDKGITLWHNPSTMLDYSQSNNIV